MADKIKSIFYVNPLDENLEAYDRRIIQEGEKPSADSLGCGVQMYYDSDGNFERSYSTPFRVVGRRSVGAEFFDSDLDAMNWLVSRLNAVNGDDFAVIEPSTDTYEGPFKGMHIYVKPEGTGTSEFSDKMWMIMRSLTSDKYAALVSQDLSDLFHDGSEKTQFMQNPCVDTVKAALDASSGLTVFPEVKPLTVDDVYAPEKAFFEAERQKELTRGISGEQLTEKVDAIKAQGGFVVAENWKNMTRMFHGKAEYGMMESRLWAYPENGDLKYALEREPHFSSEGLNRTFRVFDELDGKQAYDNLSFLFQRRDIVRSDVAQALKDKYGSKEESRAVNPMDRGLGGFMDRLLMRDVVLKSSATVSGAGKSGRRLPSVSEDFFEEDELNF